MAIDHSTLYLKLPERLDLDSVLLFGKELSGAGNYSKISLDMGEERWFPPFSMLFIATILKKFRTENTNCRIFVKNHACHPYASHVGFFRAFGLDYGKDVGEAIGSKTYIPIRVIARTDFYNGPDDRFVELPDLIQRCADDIANIICQNSNVHKDLFDVLSYSVREIFRNVFEHSEADRVFFCAQMWPSSGKVEISIADLGIGVKRGLGENPNFRFKSDKEAIEYSLMPSVSGKTHLPRRSSNWFNSGYGLYMTSRLARNGGNFVIASGNNAIKFTSKTKTNYNTWFPGTTLRLNFDTNQIGNVQSRLSEFKKDGAKIAKMISGSGNRPPSAMSLLLRRDFH